MEFLWNSCNEQIKKIGREKERKKERKKIFIGYRKREVYMTLHDILFTT